MGRLEKREVLLKRLEEILATNGANVSIDLIYGFPEQTRDIWLDDLRSVMESGVDSASIYRLKQMPGSPIPDMVEAGKLSSPASLEEQAEQFNLSNEFFRSMNARRCGVTHWAFNNRERAIYNSVSAYAGSILPVGCGAGGNLGKYGLMQSMSLDDYSGYIGRGEKPVGQMVTERRQSKALAMLNGELHLNLGLNLIEHSRRTGEEGLNELFAPLFEQWDEAGMVSYDRGSGLLRLTDAGVFHAPRIQQNILDYYKWKKEEIR
jgi:anaerobilin synthase